MKSARDYTYFINTSTQHDLTQVRTEFAHSPIEAIQETLDQARNAAGVEARQFLDQYFQNPRIPPLREALDRARASRARDNRKNALNIVLTEHQFQKRKDDLLTRCRLLKASLDATQAANAEPGENAEAECKTFFGISQFSRRLNLAYLDETHALHQMAVDRLCMEEDAYNTLYALLDQLQQFLNAIEQYGAREANQNNNLPFDPRLLQGAKQAFVKHFYLIQTIIEDFNPETTNDSFKGKKHLQVTASVLTPAIAMLNANTPQETRTQGLALQAAVRAQRYEIEGHTLFRHNSEYAAWLFGFSFIAGLVLVCCLPASAIAGAAGLATWGMSGYLAVKIFSAPNTYESQASRDSGCAMGEVVKLGIS